jgi:hypothetical protein
MPSSPPGSMGLGGNCNIVASANYLWLRVSMSSPAGTAVLGKMFQASTYRARELVVPFTLLVGGRMEYV